MKYLPRIEPLFETPETEKEWEKIADTPEREEDHKPQGLTHVEEGFILTVHRDDKETAVYLYDTSEEEFEELGVMPLEAKHTSGLGYDGEHIWALDYFSREIYRFDKEEFVEGKIEPTEIHYSGLKGASALEHINHEGREYLAISNFCWATITRRVRLPTSGSKTYIVPVESIENNPDKSARKLAVYSYENGGYSQGLVYKDGKLYESENRARTDQVNVMDFKEGGEVERITSFEAPHEAVEDMASKGDKIYVSDEKDLCFYSTEIPEEFRDTE